MAERARVVRRDADSPEPAVRRAPFAVNPAVGERGQRARRRILDAALTAFGEVGYEKCRVGRITERAGCSRVSFYQYFSSKEDVFRHLAGMVAREIVEAVAAVGPITADAAGRRALGDWFARYAQIYDEYEAVYVVFQTATLRDAELAQGARRATVRTHGAIAARIQGSSLPKAERDAVARLISEAALRGNRFVQLIAGGRPPVDLARSRLNAALADVCHRALFGAISGVNAGPRSGKAVFPRRPKPALVTSPSAAAGGRYESVLEAAHAVYVERGYHGARIDDIAKRAGISHGALYRYFRTKDELFRVLAVRSAARFTAAYDELGALDLGAPGAGAAFRRWVHEYARTCAEATAIMRVWAEALSRDPALGDDSAAAIRAACRGIVRLLTQRAAGDADAESLVMLAMLEAITAGGPQSTLVELGAHALERGLLLL